MKKPDDVMAELSVKVRRAVQVGCLYNPVAGLCTLHRLRGYVQWSGDLVATQV